MITLYTWTTPNGRKPSIMLEELGWKYEVKPVNIGKNEQFSDEFLAIAPNNKIPAIVDHDAEGGPLSIFESGAILTYLAEKAASSCRPPALAATRCSNGCTGRSAALARCWASSDTSACARKKRPRPPSNVSPKNRIAC
ncbi:glutathione S-transferase N-terminal domain-containing protein [Pigmentiphaga litoralis]|uniref:glutathione S-transferase N-terminal domain-containing protein n=1 Tax=Pigmentiphaga litoralis TaxID=516702 RepID=UPI003B42D1EC